MCLKNFPPRAFVRRLLQGLSTKRLLAGIRPGSRTSSSPPQFSARNKRDRVTPFVRDARLSACILFLLHMYIFFPPTRVYPLMCFLPVKFIRDSER